MVDFFKRPIDFISDKRCSTDIFKIALKSAQECRSGLVTFCVYYNEINKDFKTARENISPYEI